MSSPYDQTFVYGCPQTDFDKKKWDSVPIQPDSHALIWQTISQLQELIQQTRDALVDLERRIVELEKKEAK